MGFWAYRKIGLVLREGVKINKEENPPKLSSKIIIKYEPEEEIKKIIEKNQGRWYFYVKSGGYVWSQNFSGINIEETRIELGKIKSEESKLASGLPKGIKIQEKIISAGDGWELKALVTVPNREILMVMGVAETSELEATQALIPSLGQVLYWAGIQN